MSTDRSGGASCAGALRASVRRCSPRPPKALERDGFVHRDAQPVIPPRVDYSLTPRGEELAAWPVPLVTSVAEHADEIVG